MDKLLLAQEILESDIAIALMLECHCDQLEQLRDLKFQKGLEFASRIKLYIQRARGFKRTALALSKQAEGTSQLVWELTIRVPLFLDSLTVGNPAFQAPQLPKSRHFKYARRIAKDHHCGLERPEQPSDQLGGKK